MKRSIALGTVALVLLLGLSVWLFYFEPKLSLLDPDRAAENFRNMDAIFPTVAIPASTQPRPLPEGPSLSAAMLDEELPEFLARSQTTSLIVLHGGRLVHESYYQGYSVDSQATSFSAAKAVLSALIGIAIAEGAIGSVDDPVVAYRPDLADSGFADVTLNDLLRMTSGIAFDEDYSDPESDGIAIHYQLYARFRSIERLTATYPAAQPPGTSFDYASINTQALAMVLEAATGASLPDYLYEKLWNPLGMAAGATWITDVYGNAVGFWGLSARPRDLAKFGQLYLQQGAWDDEQLIPPEWIARSTEAEEPFLQRGIIRNNWGYQHKWWLPRDGDQDYAALGLWGQIIYINPHFELVVVKTSADPNFRAHEFEAVERFRQIGATLSCPTALTEC
ncbi:hypothetical protein CAI21_10030 [Alkalilimnicola ehrlichii]|uniref:Beta-lactamase-related domain-containing protein n=1 Tax=Alkalilimnicola ehrlichii TaxID=351052 RepID=A0A3E0WV85_9GAMM|nr:serine hydrolase [Alkalilimnicola ehrlichii]RFA29389.1 hypothetical protein CAI21_10030 [Alkalilimnicola ehrlichii]RFA36902.1 hypothetical protein CAL65_10360 [Alkalilimnicola ehrlichii]